MKRVFEGGHACPLLSVLKSTKMNVDAVIHIHKEDSVLNTTYNYVLQFLREQDNFVDKYIRERVMGHSFQRT